MKEYAILIPSYNRVGMCWKCIRQIRKYNSDINIFVTVEREQYRLYKKAIGKYVYLIPLEKDMLGAGYSIYFGFNFLEKLGYRYIIRLDDDVKVNFNPLIFYKVMKRYSGTFGWIAGWVSIYDLFYKGKEKYLLNSKIGLYKSTTYCPSMCYVIDLKKLNEIGGWDWRMRHLEDVCATFRFTVYGYKTGVLKLAKFSLMANTLEIGKGGISSTVINKVEAEKKNIRMLKGKYGKNVIVKKIHDNGKTDFNLRKLYDGNYEWNEDKIKVPNNFLTDKKFKKYKKKFVDNKEIESFPESDYLDHKFINVKIREMGLWKVGLGRLSFEDRFKIYLRGMNK